MSIITHAPKPVKTTSRKPAPATSAVFDQVEITVAPETCPLPWIDGAGLTKEEFFRINRAANTARADHAIDFHNATLVQLHRVGELAAKAELKRLLADRPVVVPPALPKPEPIVLAEIPVHGDVTRAVVIEEIPGASGDAYQFVVRMYEMGREIEARGYDDLAPAQRYAQRLAFPSYLLRHVRRAVPAEPEIVEQVRVAPVRSARPSVEDELWWAQESFLAEEFAGIDSDDNGQFGFTLPG